MSNKTPLFLMPQSQHFSDYGFDPQIDYFQVLEEARKHKKRNSSKSSIDTFQFKLQKPISKDDLIRTTLHKKKKNRWFWKNALHFFNWRKWPISAVGTGDGDMDSDDRDVHMARARNFRNRNRFKIRSGLRFDGKSLFIADASDSVYESTGA